MEVLEEHLHCGEGDTGGCNTIVHTLTADGSGDSHVQSKAIWRLLRRHLEAVAASPTDDVLYLHHASGDYCVATLATEFVSDLLPPLLAEGCGLDACNVKRFRLKDGSQYVMITLNTKDGSNVPMSHTALAFGHFVLGAPHTPATHPS
jgi:hypothetical protein